MTRIRLLTALQVLTTPETHTTHARAREVIAQTLGLEVQDLPRWNPEPQKTLELYLLTWLGLELA